MAHEYITRKGMRDSVNEIVFFGSVYGKDGIKPDPSKIEDIRKMPTPQDRADLQRFIGLMNYLAAYIPHFADNVSPPCENSSRRTSHSCGTKITSVPMMI